MVVRRCEGARRHSKVLVRPLGSSCAPLKWPDGCRSVPHPPLQVALKQLIPDNEVALFGGALKFRAKVGQVWFSSHLFEQVGV